MDRSAKRTPVMRHRALCETAVQMDAASVARMHNGISSHAFRSGLTTREMDQFAAAARAIVRRESRPLLGAQDAAAKEVIYRPLHMVGLDPVADQEPLDL